MLALTSYHLYIFVQESSNEKKSISIRDMYYTILVGTYNKYINDFNSQRNMQFWVDNKQAQKSFFTLLHWWPDFRM